MNNELKRTEKHTHNRDQSPPRKCSPLCHKWSDISGDPRIVKVYPMEATHADRLPFALRNWLGDLLLELTLTKAQTIEEKRAFVKKIKGKIGSGTYPLWMLWTQWSRLYYDIIGRTHTINSIYSVLYHAMQAEREYAPKMLKEKKQ